MEISMYSISSSVVILHLLGRAAGNQNLTIRAGWLGLAGKVITWIVTCRYN